MSRRAAHKGRCSATPTAPKAMPASRWPETAQLYWDHLRPRANSRHSFAPRTSGASKARQSQPVLVIALCAATPLHYLHRAGAGPALLRAVLDQAEPAALWVADPNPRAQAFYRRNGFVADGTTQVQDGVREIRMLREAQPPAR